jgi:uncharacterized protein
VNRSVVAELIQREHPRIRELGVARLALFGSAARDEMNDASDIDVLVVFHPGHKTFDDFMELKLLLEDLFPTRRIDLVLESSLKPTIRDKVLSEARDVV